jgi:hypothetical protein
MSTVRYRKGARIMMFHSFKISQIQCSVVREYGAPPEQEASKPGVNHDHWIWEECDPSISVQHLTIREVACVGFGKLLNPKASKSQNSPQPLNRVKDFGSVVGCWN